MHVARASVRKVLLPFAMLAVISAAIAPGVSAARPTRIVAGPAFGFILPRGAGGIHGGGGLAQPQAAARRSANMTYHGGKIMPTAVTKAFFRGTSWGTYSGDKMTGIDTWYSGFSGSRYQGTVTEYTDSTGAHAGQIATNHQGHFVDTTAETSKGNTASVLAEISAMVNASGTVIDPAGNSYFALYSDQKRGSAGYCAWHSAGTINGKPVQYAFFWNLDGDAGCDPQDTSGLHSQGLAAISNVTGHELAEAMSDPASPGAWYDSSGAENGDKCAWTFGAPLVTFSNGSQWKVQGEWSNAAFTAGTGYANSSGQKGCLGGA